MKKFLTLALALLMVCMMLPVVAMAEEGAEGVGASSGPVEVWTGYTGTKVGSYDSIEDAVNNLGTNKWIVIGGNYTITKDFTIPEGVFLDVARDAILTVDNGITLTVAADAKRLGVRTGATLVNNGTIMVCGTDYNNGKVMVQDGAVFDTTALSVPEGHFLDKNGSNYFATEVSKAKYEITFNDGTIILTADKTNAKGGNVKQIKLLKDVSTGGWSIDTSVGSDVILDLNGYTVRYDGTNTRSCTLNISTKVTIKGGTVEYTGTASGAIQSTGNLTIASDAIIDGGAGYGINATGYGHTFTVNGTVKSSSGAAITGNGSETNGEIDSCNITINKGAVISASNGIGIYHPELGTITVNGGTITGITGIEMRAGELNVIDGDIIATGTTLEVAPNENGTTTEGAAIAVVQHTTKQAITVNISGGNLQGAAAINEANPQNNSEEDTAKVKVNVTGGEFRGEVGKSDDASTLTIVGGTYYSYVGRTEELEKFVPESSEVMFDGSDGIKVRPKNTTIVIIRPTEEEKPAEDTKNPATGANDVVGVAAALAVVALVSGAAISLKK